MASSFSFQIYAQIAQSRRDGITWERGRPARILSLWLPLSISAMLQAATLWARTASAVGEMAEAVPGFVRAGRPRSQEAVIP